MKNIFFLGFFFSFILTTAFVHATDAVMDIYTGKGTPCQDNGTYTYDSNNLKYACVIKKTDGTRSLVINGKEDVRYSGVETAYFDVTGNLIAQMMKDGKYFIMVGDKKSPLSIEVPLYTTDNSGNIVISYRTDEGYGWMYNFEVKESQGIYDGYTASIMGGTSLLTFDVLTENSSGYAIWYDRVFLNGKRILSEYSRIMYQGEYTKGDSRVVILIANKGKNTEILALGKSGKVKKLASVPTTFESSPFFAANGSDYTKFAMSYIEGDKTRIITNNGLSPIKYDAVYSLFFYEQFGFYKEVLRDGKQYFSLGDKGFGPYDSIGSFSTSISGKAWFITVTKGDKEYFIVNGKEISL